MAVSASGLNIAYVAPIVVVQSYDSALDAVVYSFSTAITETHITFSDVTTGNVTSTKHGYAPKAPADATMFLNGASTPVYAQVKDSDLATSDITTNNVSTTKHGFAPKAPNDATKYLDGTGAYSVPPAAGGATATAAWMPLTTVVGGVPDLVWSGTDNLIPTYGPV